MLGLKIIFFNPKKCYIWLDDSGKMIWMFEEMRAKLIFGGQNLEKSHQVIFEGDRKKIDTSVRGEDIEKLSLSKS